MNSSFQGSVTVDVSASRRVLPRILCSQGDGAEESIYHLPSFMDSLASIVKELADVCELYVVSLFERPALLTYSRSNTYFTLLLKRETTVRVFVTVWFTLFSFRFPMAFFFPSNA